MKYFVLLLFLLLFFIAGAQAAPVKILFHGHVSDIAEDDGKKPLTDLVEKARYEGYDCLIITPHNDKGSDNTLAINNLIGNLSQKEAGLTIIAGIERSEPGVHIINFGGARIWAHPGFPNIRAAPQTPCVFYEAFNARLANEIGLSICFPPLCAANMLPLVGEDWHGESEPFRTAIIADAENKSEAAIMAALENGNYSLFVDGADVTSGTKLLAECLNKLFRFFI